ncbi:MAG: hypothetical protein KDI62_00875 [Anaerolineae bacterium]|nr:hypothetical protein [Anaerolineae bacterium]
MCEQFVPILTPKTVIVAVKAAPAGLKVRSAAKIQRRRGRRLFHEKISAFGAEKRTFRSKNRFYGGHEGVSRKKSGKYGNSRRPTKKKGVIVEI